MIILLFSFPLLVIGNISKKYGEPLNISQVEGELLSILFCLIEYRGFIQRESLFISSCNNPCHQVANWFLMIPKDLKLQTVQPLRSNLADKTLVSMHLNENIIKMTSTYGSDSWRKLQSHLCEKMFWRLGAIWGQMLQVEWGQEDLGGRRKILQVTTIEWFEQILQGSRWSHYLSG